MVSRSTLHRKFAADENHHAAPPCKIVSCITLLSHYTCSLHAKTHPDGQWVLLSLGFFLPNKISCYTVTFHFNFLLHLVLWDCAFFSSVCHKIMFLAAEVNHRLNIDLKGIKGI